VVEAELFFSRVSGHGLQIRAIGLSKKEMKMVFFHSLTVCSYPKGGTFTTKLDLKN
jgi:hypothetical protein